VVKTRASSKFPKRWVFIQQTVDPRTQYQEWVPRSGYADETINFRSDSSFGPAGPAGKKARIEADLLPSHASTAASAHIPGALFWGHGTGLPRPVGGDRPSRYSHALPGGQLDDTGHCAGAHCHTLPHRRMRVIAHEGLAQRRMPCMRRCREALRHMATHAPMPRSCLSLSRRAALSRGQRGEGETAARV